MAKRLKASEAAAAGPKKYPEVEKLLQVLNSIDTYKADLDAAGTAHATEWKRIDALQLEKKAVKLALTLRAMPATKRDVFLADFDWLRDKLGFDAQGNLFDLAGDGQGDAAADAHAEARGDAPPVGEGGPAKLDDRAKAGAYIDGHTAGKAGKRANENPYDGKVGAFDLAEAWCLGWTDGQAELVNEGLGGGKPARRGNGKPAPVNENAPAAA